MDGEMDCFWTVPRNQNTNETQEQRIVNKFNILIDNNNNNNKLSDSFRKEMV